MIVSLTQFDSLAVDNDGNKLPLGQTRLACEVRTAAGAFATLEPGAKFVRVATDTAIQMDISGGVSDATSELIMPGVEYFAVSGAEDLDFVAA